MHRQPDPFADPEMRERVAKLIRLLASDAAGEADAARTALLRLLTRHGASLDDLTQRLLGPTPDDLPTLQTYLTAAERRAALAEAASRTARAETERLRTSATFLRIIAIGGGGAAVLLLALALLPSSDSSGHRSPDPVAPAPAFPDAPSPPPLRPAPQPPPAVPSPPPPAPLSAAPGPEPARQPVTTARRGQVVAPEGVLLRLDPVPGVDSVALLPQGTKVIIDQAFPMLGTDWMQVRSPKGAGFVPASTIGPE
jgi:hypothetical protein